jgi:hypothetical protein
LVDGVHHGTVVDIRILSDPVICLRTGRIAVHGQGFYESAHVSGFLSGGDRIVEFSYAERNYGGVWMWNLDDAPPASG